MFFEAKDGYSYPVSRIVRISKPRDHIVSVELTDERLVQVDDFRLEEIMRQPIATFSAQPGTYAIDVIYSDPGDLYKNPIIGWAMLVSGALQPITALGLNDGDTAPVSVLTPDGKVCDGGLWDSIEAWRDSKKDEKPF